MTKGRVRDFQAAHPTPRRQPAMICWRARGGTGIRTGSGIRRPVRTCGFESLRAHSRYRTEPNGEGTAAADWQQPAPSPATRSPPVYLAYFDESGDSGPYPSSPTQFFVLGCVLINEAVWLSNLNALIHMRERIRDKIGVGMREELKSSHIRKGRGPLFGLRFSHERRAKMMNVLLRYCAQKLKMEVFAVAIDKKKLQGYTKPQDVRFVAWDFAIQRVHNYCEHEHSFASVYPDRGHGNFIRQVVRRKRRHQPIAGKFGGVLSAPVTLIIEDPNDRDSKDSYFIQLADWCAYAAHRSRYVDPCAPGFETAWDNLGAARVLAVNKFDPDPRPPGIKIHP